MSNRNISDEYLNSFIDNQLDSTERVHAFATIRQDDKLKDQVCELRSLKEAIQLAYNQPPVKLALPAKPLRPWMLNLQSLAACLLLLLGGVSGWLTHAWIGRDSSHETSTMMHATLRNDLIAEPRKIIVHISDSKPMKLKAALDETESLLDTYRRTNRQIQVEVIANQHGVDLLRSNVSAYKGRISLMQEKYPNLHFLVCGQTLGKLRGKGENVQLLPHTLIASSAANQINKRLHEGWGYIRI